MCFQGSPRSWGMAPQRSAHQAYFQGLSSQVRAVCRLHLPSLANTFPGKRSTARGEGGFRSVSAPQRDAMLGPPSRGHLALSMGPQGRVAGGALACEKLKQRAQLALAEGSKQPREAFASSCWAAPRQGSLGKKSLKICNTNNVSPIIQKVFLIVC